MSGDKLLYTLLKDKLNYAIDSVFLWADIVLQSIRLGVDKYVPRLQGWLFLQNQRFHSVDVKLFCNDEQDDNKEEGAD